MKTNWLYILILLLVVEKTIQHIVVTVAFYFNWMDIASTVTVSTTSLMILGALVAVLFAIALLAMIRKHHWSIQLIIALALFDIVGEFVAQGRIDIKIPISFIVAILLFVLAVTYRKQLDRIQIIQGDTK
ncbi:MAG: hypothetical protein L6Q49_09755 [Anaerolineales bacterium]|nr:hypothetical protein [Anaerolineales bacterium]